MPTGDRYYLRPPLEGDAATLSGDEAHHLLHVMRAKIGVTITLFDGEGHEYDAQVEQIKRQEALLKIVARRAVNRELPSQLVMAVTLPKGDRQKWLVEKAVELGVSKLMPVATARSVAQPAENALTRLRRAVVEASKQCGRNRLMEIAEPQAWADFVASTREFPMRWIAHPQDRSVGVSGEAQEGFVNEARCANAATPVLPPSPVLVAVGPEGGFTEEEVALAMAAGWRSVDLGPRILRIETAALFLASVVIAPWQATRPL
jgi:16S rRNA (uracil1498-N3)-methyltransferase